MLRYIRYNKTLDLKYYYSLNDAPISDLLRKSSLETENPLIDFSNFSWQDCPDTGSSTRAYVIFYQGGPIDNVTRVPGPVAQYSVDSEYNATCTAGMALAHFRI